MGNPLLIAYVTSGPSTIGKQCLGKKSALGWSPLLFLISVRWTLWGHHGLVLVKILETFSALGEGLGHRRS